MNYIDHWAKYVNSFRRIEDDTFANDFLRLFDRSFEENEKSHVFDIQKTQNAYSRTLIYIVSVARHALLTIILPQIRSGITLAVYFDSFRMFATNSTQLNRELRTQVSDTSKSAS